MPEAEISDPAAMTALDQPRRDFGLWSAFALAFSSISPIVGIYSVFTISLLAAGPSFLWALPVALIGQLLVTAVLGELVSKWPLQGSVYAWSRQLVGPRFGWATNWIYMWATTMTLSVLALAATGNLYGAFGNTGPSPRETEVLALGVILLGSVANMVGGKLLKCLLYISLLCELVASIGIGTFMFMFRTNSFSTIFTTAGTGHGFHWLSNPFLICITFAGYSFTGFEGAGAIAEEVKESRRVLPMAMILALAACGFLVTYACLSITLAIPNLDPVMNGTIADPIASTLELRLGSGVGRILLIMLAIGLTACLIAVQTSVTRSIWAAARDNVLPAGSLLGTLSGSEHLPRHAIALTAVVAGALLFISTSKLYTLLLSFSNVGVYLSYGMPLLGAVYVRQRGLWMPGNFSLGRFSTPITYISALWVVFECVNIAWPRPVNPQWYLNWGVIIMVTALGALGLGVSVWVFRPTANR